MTTVRRAALDVPLLRWWSRQEVFLAGVLLSLAGSAWILTHLMGTPEMRVGVLASPLDVGMNGSFVRLDAVLATMAEQK